MKTLLSLAAFAALAVSLAGCGKKTKSYVANVEIQRFDMRADDKGKPLSADLEFSYFECPGTQIEVIRGNGEFATCMKKHKLGDKVPVKIEHHWSDADGAWDWDVLEVGECKRPYEEGDEASFDTVQECEDIKAHGATVGFHCNRIPQKALLEKCPWFGRH
jgi:hypothetical protein